MKAQVLKSLEFPCPAEARLWQWFVGIGGGLAMREMIASANLMLAGFPMKSAAG